MVSIVAPLEWLSAAIPLRDRRQAREQLAMSECVPVVRCVGTMRWYNTQEVGRH
jgi:hypothetical protein